jgi:hypothetical protein
VSPTISATDEAFVDAIDTKPAPKDSLPSSAEDKYALTGDIIALLQELFPDHPTIKLPDATRMMTKCVRDCIDIAGSGELCLDVLEGIFDKETCATVMTQAKFLGGYIRGAFKTWLAERIISNKEYLTDAVDDLCKGYDGFYALPVFRSSPHKVSLICTGLQEC